MSNWNAGSGDWGTASDWTPSGVPDSAAAVAVLGGTNSYTVTVGGGESFKVGTLTVSDANAQLFIGGKLEVVKTATISAGNLTVQGALVLGGTLSLLSGSSMALNGGGVIQGGTLNDAGGVINFNGGTLDGVTDSGPLVISTPNQFLNIANGITVSAISVTGANDTLQFVGVQTIDSDTISVGTSSGPDFVNVVDGQTGSGLLTLGTNLNLTSASGSTQTNVFVGGSPGATLVNNGTITAQNAQGGFTLRMGTFINQGLVHDTGGDSLYVNVGTFDNAGGTVTVDAGSTVHLQSGLYTNGLGDLQSNGGIFALDGTLNNNDATFSVGTGSNPGRVAFDGIIQNGTIHDGGSGFTFQNGSLDRVTYIGAIDMSATQATLNVFDGITLRASNGTSPGTLNLTGFAGALNFRGSQTINRATINIGNNAATDVINVFDVAGGVPATLTLGSNLTVNAAGTFAQFAGNPDAALINWGTINAGIANSTFAIDVNEFANAGQINVTNGEVLFISPGFGGFTNSGTITVGTGSTLRLQGTIKSPLGTIKSTGGSVELDGVLKNVGGTLSVGTGSLIGRMALFGSVQYGTIKDGGNGFAFDNGSFDGVTYQGAMNLTALNSTLNVFDGIALTGSGGSGAGTINLTGQNASLNFRGNQTIDKATINIGGGSGTDFLNVFDNGPPATLTFGSGLHIVSAGNGAFLAGPADTTIINEGTISAGTANAVFTIAPGTFHNSGTVNVTGGDTVVIDAIAGFTNTGSITVASNSALHLRDALVTRGLGSITSTGGSIFFDPSAVLDNSRATLSVGTGTALGTVVLEGTVQHGTIKDSGSGFTFAGGNFDGVKYEGTLDLSGNNAFLNVYGGLTATGSAGLGAGAINFTGYAGVLNFHGTQRLDGGTLTMGNTVQDVLNVFDVGVPVTLTLGSLFTIQGVGQWSIGGSGDSEIVNRGTIVASGAVTDFFGGGYVQNIGLIHVTNGATLLLMPFNRPLENYSGGLLSGGSYEVDANSKLVLSNNTLITTLAAKIILSGANADIYSTSTFQGQQLGLESTLTAVAASGNFDLVGHTFTTKNGFSNAGQIYLINSTFGARGVANNGTITAFSGSSVLNAPVSGAGEIVISATKPNVTLELGGSVGAGQQVTFSGSQTGILLIDAVAGFSAKQVNGFNSLDKLELGNVAFGSGTHLSYTQGSNSGLLSVTDGTHTANITLFGQYVAADFQAAGFNSNKSTAITYTGPSSATAQAPIQLAAHG